MFYTYNQNNSGGSFVYNDKVCCYVIIEADNAKESNTIAEDIGIYFDGCDNDIDCPCCGDRWYPTDEYDAKEEPRIYSMTPDEYRNDEWGMNWTNPGEVYCRVYHKNGTVEEFVK